MAAEQAFARTFLNTISTQPITYSDDYQQPSQNSLKRVPVLQIPVPPPPERKTQSQASTSSSASISLVFKSLKPPASYTVSVRPTDTVSSIKAQLAAQPTAPPADAQRLLLKGKALADAKLLQEYSIKNGDTVNLVLKPGFDWDPTKPPTSKSPEVTMASPTPSSLQPSPSVKPSGGRKHQRIPSVVLSPSPSNDSLGTVEKDIMLTLDAGIPSPVVQQESTYYTTVVKPEFWERLYAFLKLEFITSADAYLAFEDFLCATKGSLTPSEIAKIRDQVGVVGMAGT